MPEVTREYRTIMYSLGEKGEVVVHKLPYNANEKLGMEILKKFVNRGFTFEDPREDKGMSKPEVIVTKEVVTNKPEEEEQEEKPSLYVSDKPPKPKKKRKKK